MGNSKVPAALKPLPALDPKRYPNPTLSRSPPLGCGQKLFIKDNTGVPTRFFVDRLGRG